MVSFLMLIFWLVVLAIEMGVHDNNWFPLIVFGGFLVICTIAGCCM